jgi:hypothetical protein
MLFNKLHINAILPHNCGDERGATADKNRVKPHALDRHAAATVAANGLVYKD